MNHQDLFQDVVPLLRPEGGVAVVTNETPLWLQETDWSRVLRDFLQHWLGTTLTHACGTDEQSQRRYRDDLAAAGFDSRHAICLPVRPDSPRCGPAPLRRSWCQCLESRAPHSTSNVWRWPLNRRDFASRSGCPGSVECWRPRGELSAVRCGKAVPERVPGQRPLVARPGLAEDVVDVVILQGSRTSR